MATAHINPAILRWAMDRVGVRATETSIRDAFRLLGVKPANLPKLRESMGAGS